MRIVHKLPAPTDEENAQAHEDLRKLASEGLGRLLAADKGFFAARSAAEVMAQLDWEIEWVVRNRMASKYLLLRDIILHAEQNGIPVSVGYERMGNTLLAYTILGISKLNPYRYDLVIDRSSHFISELGICVSADRCGELIRYVKDTYDYDGNTCTLDLVELPALDLLQGVLNRVKHKCDAELFWESVSLDDKDTFDLLGRGDTEGVYQLGSEEARRGLRDWSPASLNELVDFIALNRIEPWGLISQALIRRKGGNAVPRVDQIFASLTDDTYGILIYQEQLIRAIMVLAGYSGDESAHLRRIMCGKLLSKVEEACGKFIGCCMIKSGVTEDRARALFYHLEAHSAYTTNKAYYVEHGLLTYRMAYLKAHWRDEFEAEARCRNKKGIVK